MVPRGEQADHQSYLSFIGRTGRFFQMGAAGKIARSPPREQGVKPGRIRRPAKDEVIHVLS
jgi:hypothetical protein